MPRRPAHQLPDSAAVVVVGGGVIGSSAAFHLAEAGVDVVLVERAQLGGGSTCRAAGGVRTQFSDLLNIEIAQRSLAAFRDFKRRPGWEIELKRVGYLFVLTRASDLDAFEESVALQNECGLDSRIVTAGEARALCPLLEGEDILAGAFSPGDGHATPEGVVQGYAFAARAHGAHIRVGCEVLAIDTSGDQITGVITSHTIDFESSFYFHREGPGLLIGMSDANEQPGFSVETTEDWIPDLMAVLRRRAPRIVDAGIRGGWAGLYEMTPDHNAIIGEVASVSRFLYATGFSGHGFLQGPAVGEILRDIVLRRPTFVDVTPLSVERFDASALRPEYNIV